MVRTRKLRPEPMIGAFIVPSIVLVIFVTLHIFLGDWTAYSFMAGLFFLLSAVSLVSFLRTRNYSYLVVMLFQFSIGMFCASVFDGVFFINRDLTRFWQFCTFFFAAAAMYLLINRKLTWRGREVLELAAEPVTDVTNGFTQRPRNAGQTDITEAQLKGFAAFLSKNLIAMPYRLDDRTVFVLVGNWEQSLCHILGLRRDLTDQTWVSVDRDGNIDVNIARSHYLKYEEGLSFDQLCESMGNRFIEFLELFKRGEEIRIIHRMNALRLSPIA